MEYTVKYWNTKKDFDLGNAEFIGHSLSENNSELVANALHRYGVYAVEIFETESGNTIYYCETIWKLYKKILSLHRDIKL